MIISVILRAAHIEWLLYFKMHYFTYYLRPNTIFYILQSFTAQYIFVLSLFCPRLFYYFLFFNLKFSRLTG